MSSRRHWSVEDDYDSYSYSRPTRYSNVSSNVYVTPQRYVPSVSESYSPVGKTYIRSIPAVAHQRLTTTSYPPRSYVPTHYDEERILGYRSPPSSHHITTTSYRPYLDDEPQIEYIPWQPRQYEYRATPSYTDTWKSHISPQTKARWSALLEDEDDNIPIDEDLDPNLYVPKKGLQGIDPPSRQYQPKTEAMTDYDEKYNNWLTHEKSVARRSDTMVPYHRPAMITAPVHTSYADRYQRELEDSMSEFSGAVIPSSTFMSKHSIYPQTKPITHRPIKPRGHMDDHHADEYPAHGRKYVVLPMQKVFNDIYNMSFYRKPMREANIGFKKHQPYIPSDGVVRSAKRQTNLTDTEKGQVEKELNEEKQVTNAENKDTDKTEKDTDTTKTETENKQGEKQDTEGKQETQEKSAEGEKKVDEQGEKKEDDHAHKKKEKKKKKKHDVDLDEEAIMRMVEEEMAAAKAGGKKDKADTEKGKTHTEKEKTDTEPEKTSTEPAKEAADKDKVSVKVTVTEQPEEGEKIESSDAILRRLSQADPASGTVTIRRISQVETGDGATDKKFESSADIIRRLSTIDPVIDESEVVVRRISLSPKQIDELKIDDDNSTPTVTETVKVVTVETQPKVTEVETKPKEEVKIISEETQAPVTALEIQDVTETKPQE